LSGTARHRGRQTSEGKTTAPSHDTDVQGTATSIPSDDVAVDDRRREENTTTVPRSKQNGDIENVDDKQPDSSAEATTQTDNEITEVTFLIPERQQTAEEFDICKFFVDVEQLAASLRAVVHRQEVDDFQGDSLAEMVSAVVGTMLNFQTFSNRVYDLLDAVRDQMKAATDFMSKTIFHPTKWDNLTFKGESHCISSYC